MTKSGQGHDLQQYYRLPRAVEGGLRVYMPERNVGSLVRRLRVWTANREMARSQRALAEARNMLGEDPGG